MRKFAAVALAAALLAGTTGCSFNPHPESLQDYAPSEGSEGEVGEVSVHNILVLTNPQNQQTLVVGSIINSGLDTEHAVIQQPTAAGNVVLFETDIAAGQKIDLGFGMGAQVGLAPATEAYKAGSLVDLYLVVGSGSDKVHTPVLDGTLAQYTDLVNSLGVATPAPTN